jgi:hypothetical protein
MKMSHENIVKLRQTIRLVLKDQERAYIERLVNAKDEHYIKEYYEEVISDLVKDALHQCKAIIEHWQQERQDRSLNAILDRLK